MNILSLDTSGPSAGVALMQGGIIVCSVRRMAGVTHSETLMPMVDDVLQYAGISPKEIDLIACVSGPGSFTGVRIGICAAKGMAQALGCKVCEVNALEALVYAHKGFDGAICPVLDARRGQVYCAAFCFADGERPRRILPDAALPLGEFIKQLPQGEKMLFTGDAMTFRAEEILSAAGANAIAAPASARDIDPASVCALALLSEPTEGIELRPLYLRAPQAERERAAKGGA